MSWVLALLLGYLPLRHANAQSLWTTPLPAPQSYRLDNGLEVILAPHSRSQQVLVAMSYHVGRRDDPSGYEGLAHLLEHLTFRGSKHVPDGDFARHIQSVGGNFNGMTFADHTVYVQEVPATELPLGLWLESERMAFTLAQLSEEKLEIEKKVVHAEWAQRQGDFVNGRVPELLSHATYPESHPYYRANDLDERTSRVSIDNVRWYYQHFYRPENARLVVAGRFEPEVARHLIERYFASVKPSGVATARIAAPAVVFDGAQRLDLRVHGRGRPIVSMHFRLPCGDVVCRTESDALAAYLAHGSHSPLSDALEAADHAAVDSGAQAIEAEHEVSFKVWAVAADEDRVEQVERVLESVLREARTRGVDPERWGQVQLAMASRTMNAAQQLFGRAIALCLQPQGSKPQHVDDVLDALKTCTSARLSTLAKRVLREDRRLLVVTHPSQREVAGRVTDVEGDLRLRVLHGDEQ